MEKLSDSFYITPDTARQTLTREELRQVMMNTEGKIISCGRLRELYAKYLGAGIYLLTLKKAKNG